jgi:hypothetical protein
MSQAIRLRLLVRERMASIEGKTVKGGNVLQEVSGSPGVTRAFNRRGQVAPGRRRLPTGLPASWSRKCRSHLVESRNLAGAPKLPIPDQLSRNGLKCHDFKESDRVCDQFPQCFESLVHRIELTCTMVSVISTMDAGNLYVYQPTLYVCMARKTMYHPNLYHGSAHFPMC